MDPERHCCLCYARDDSWRLPRQDISQRWVGPWPAAIVGIVLIASLWRAHWAELRYLTIWQKEGLKSCDDLESVATQPTEPWEFRVELEGRGKPIERGET